jgi:hypothetical protein
MARHAKGSNVKRAVLVERYLAQPTPRALADLAAETDAAVAALAADGVTVSYMRSIAIPQDETCFCIFDADSRAVEELNDRLTVVSIRIVPVLQAEPTLLIGG